MPDPLRRRFTKPGGTERDRLRDVWAMTEVSGVPDEREERCLQALLRFLSMGAREPVAAALRVAVEWDDGPEAGPIVRGDGFAAVVARLLITAFEVDDEDASPHDGFEGSYQHLRVDTRYIPLHRAEEAEWVDTAPYPVIAVRGEGGVACRLTDFHIEVGSSFYEVLVTALEVQWGRELDAANVQDRRSAARGAVARASGDRGEPPRRLVRSAADAEQAAATWMRWLGIKDAEATPTGPDEGVDVLSEEAVAQVKAQMVAIGRPEVQKLLGASTRAGKRALFFSLGGYTSGAVEFADATDVALFVFDLQGQPEPINDPAVDLMREFLGDDPGT